MTEEEARTKKCPNIIVRVTDTNGCTVGVSSNCIASDCMMWQWELLEGQEVPSGRLTVTYSKDIGYCGLVR